MVETSQQQIRRALRGYFCHACNKEFKEMVNLNDVASVRCPHCSSDFLEEKKSYEENKEQPQPEPQPQSQPQPQAQQQRPQMHQQTFIHQSQGGMPGGGGVFQQSSQQSSFGPGGGGGGWSQQINISFGQNGQPQVQRVVINRGGGGGGAQRMQSQMSSAPNEFASMRSGQAQHSQAQSQAQNQHHSAAYAHQQAMDAHQHAMGEAQRQRPRVQDPFIFNSQPRVVDPFQHMDEFHNGFSGARMSGFGPRGSAAEQQRPEPQPAPQNPHPGPQSIFDVMSGMMGGQGGGAGIGGMFFANGGFPGQEAQQASGCSTDYIKNLPQKDAGKDTDCYICLEKCKDGELSCQLPCGHAFDRACIEHWIKDNDSCPVCRVKLDQRRPQDQQQNHQNQGERLPHPGMPFFF